jgi:DNA/RNA-binding domain of Phe-tRNA-synthetase-like protein
VSAHLDLRAAPGFIEPAVKDEFPGLRLDWMTIEARPQASPRAVKDRLSSLASRYHGADVVAMRTKPIPRAYRTFYRQIGMDPDADRPPSERAAVARLLQGGFRSVDLIQDSLLIAVVETGVPVWALDADPLDAGGLGIRTTLEGDRLGSGAQAEHPPTGSLAVADAQRLYSLLFGDVHPDHSVGPRSRRLALYAVGVEGVPTIHVEEALWLCAQMLRTGRVQ